MCSYSGTRQNASKVSTHLGSVNLVNGPLSLFYDHRQLFQSTFLSFKTNDTQFHSFVLSQLSTFLIEVLSLLVVTQTSTAHISLPVSTENDLAPRLALPRQLNGHQKSRPQSRHTRRVQFFDSLTQLLFALRNVLAHPILVFVSHQWTH